MTMKNRKELQMTHKLKNKRKLKNKKTFQKWAGSLLLSAAVVLSTLGGVGEFPALKAEASESRTLTERFSEEMDDEIVELITEAGEALNEIAAQRDIMAVVYLSDQYPIRQEPSYDSQETVTVLSGQTVNILDVYVDDNYEVWEYVNLLYNGEEYYGYIPRTFLAVSDARFLEWEKNYGLNPEASVYAVDGSDKLVYPDIEQFPESYRPALYALKESHPNWIFTKMVTGMDWNEVIASQLQGSKSLVYKTFPEWAKAGLYDSGDWYFATEAVLKIYMDPRNALTESSIFQFELLTYNEEYHTKEAIQKLLESTFMNDSQPATGTDLTYSTIFWSIGSEEGRKVSPFHLAARVLQEQGVQGDSPLISGTYPGYENLYNYFNVGASGTTRKEVIESGLKYAAMENPAINKVVWNNAYTSILGGANFISANYIKKKQDTLYLQKFNVVPDGEYKPHTHQYMQNISAPTTESANVRKLYASVIPLEESTFVFKIPVFENMPEAPCEKPAETLNLSLKVPEGYAEPVIYLDGVAYGAEIRNGYYVLDAPDKNAKTAIAYRYDASGVPVGMYVWSLTYDGVAYRATEEPELADLLTVHGFSIRITGNSGIRFKTGISTDVRAALTSTGINGYTLKEYGTLIMNHANVGTYPMILGGEKTKQGMAYGVDANGVQQDVIFETVDGRHRYTAVLVGLPSSNYKTEFAFRGYAVLEKNGQQITLYGPIRARSIYSLAKQLLEINTYAPGTDAYNFLQQLIADADAYESTVSSGNTQ